MATEIASDARNTSSDTPTMLSSSAPAATG